MTQIFNIVEPLQYRIHLSYMSSTYFHSSLAATLFSVTLTAPALLLKYANTPQTITLNPQYSRTLSEK